MYEIAEELTAAFSRLEPSMQPVLLIHYDTDVQNKTTKQNNIFTDNSSNKNSQNSKNSKNSKNKNNYLKSKLKSYVPYAVTGSSLRMDEANEIFSDEKQEDLDTYQLEEQNVQTEREKPGMVVMNGAPSFVTVGGIRFDQEEEEEKKEKEKKEKTKTNNNDDDDDAEKNAKQDKQKELFTDKNSFMSSSNKYMMMTLDAKEITLRTYNVSVIHVNQFSSIISKLLSWARSRSHLLQQILHQKMGLFAHSTTALSTKTTVFVEGGGRGHNINRLNQVDRTNVSRLNSQRLSSSNNNGTHGGGRVVRNVRGVRGGTELNNNNTLSSSNNVLNRVDRLSRGSRGVRLNNVSSNAAMSRRRSVDGMKIDLSFSKSENDEEEDEEEENEIRVMKKKMRVPLGISTSKKVLDKTLASVGATPIDDQRNTRRFNRSNIDGKD